MKAVREQISDQIRARKILPFASFMELALYSPDGGYYEREKNPGRRGDFFTSVSVGPLFGELLAFQFAEWLEELPADDCKLQIAEAGAHNGQLAGDILKWLKAHRPKLFSRLEYVIVEPSPRRQGWQKEMLAEFAGKVFWIEKIAGLKTSRGLSASRCQIIFSNELLDAFPVHRLGWDAKNKSWHEWGVALDGDQFVWAKIPHFQFSNPDRSPAIGRQLEDVLPDNFTIEISPAAENWWREAAGVLENGKLLALDYGFTTEEQFSPARATGTLRGYFQHRLAADLLANPGEQDLTAHVNFSVLRQIGEDAGLITEFFHTQSKFLTEILAQAARSNFFGEWNSSRTRQFQTLTHPEHLGRAFRALIQSR